MLNVKGTGARTNPNLLRPGVRFPLQVNDNSVHLLLQQFLLLHPTIHPRPTGHPLVMSSFVDLPLLGNGSFAYKCHCQRGCPNPGRGISPITNTSLLSLLQWSPIVFISELVVFLCPVPSWIQFGKCRVCDMIPAYRSLDPTVDTHFNSP